MSVQRERLWRECAAEAVGTFVLVLFGTGAVHAAAFSGAQAGLWQVAVVWGVAVALAIYSVGAISGAHLNPAVTAAFAVFRGFPARKIAPYVLSQLAGAFLAAALLHALYGGVLARFEATHTFRDGRVVELSVAAHGAAQGLTRGGPGSERTAMAYGEYFPNPAGGDVSPESVSLAQAMLAEGVGTAMLALFIFAMTDGRTSGRPGGTFPAVMIGLAVAIIISIVAPLTQAGLNPARDFGPRLFSYFAGWGAVAIPGPRGGFFTVYILAPVLGAVVGAGAHQFLLRPALRGEDRPVGVEGRMET